MATMGGLRYGWWGEERDKIVNEKRGWNSQHSGRHGGGGGGGGAHDDGNVFDGRRWIRYCKGWCREPGDCSCIVKDGKKKNDYSYRAMKKGPSNHTVLQPLARTVQWQVYSDDDQKNGRNIDNEAEDFIRETRKKFYLASQMEH